MTNRRRLRSAQSWHNLVGQDDALRQGRLQGEQRCFDLMRVQVYGGVEQRHGQAVHAARGPTRQVVSEILGVMGGQRQLRRRRQADRSGSGGDDNPLVSEPKSAARPPQAAPEVRFVHAPERRRHQRLATGAGRRCHIAGEPVRHANTPRPEQAAHDRR